MRIILDTNTLFSALIKDSTTRKIILEYNGKFLLPEYIFDEMKKHQVMLYQKTKLDEKEFEQLLQIILTKVEVVPIEKLIEQRVQSLQIMEKIDINDALFIACALAYPNSVIWTEDKDFKKQSKIKVMNTAEIIEKIRMGLA
ncbi:MAG: PIN domain-containing protein [Candidatus Diapherotrites archaeon]|uniref:PIN domain-containing protein n=1 Tax=Candidatus Iainarchaeum sp. TaxID=3101447 RepID=A0A8T4C752_9ARCH|nr:PIN domain-containing protein [Candidatus Diapherotrites archaeon]